MQEDSGRKTKELYVHVCNYKRIVCASFRLISYLPKTTVIFQTLIVFRNLDLVRKVEWFVGEGLPKKYGSKQVKKYIQW